MSLLWKTAADLNPLDLSRALDKAREETENAHQDDLTFVPDWEPLHRSSVPESEYRGWMFMNRHIPHPDDHVANYVHDPALGKTWDEVKDRFNPNIEHDRTPPRGLVQYKHGISRQNLMLDENGHAWKVVRKDGYNGLDQGRALSGPMDAHGVLKQSDHYDTLHTLGATPETPYDLDYQVQRNQRMKEHGFDVITSGPLGD